LGIGKQNRFDVDRVEPTSRVLAPVWRGPYFAKLHKINHEDSLNADVAIGIDITPNLGATCWTEAHEKRTNTHAY
jgi:hypothetical protein